MRDWLDAGEAPVVMSGMIGSRQGWKEAPYAQCPAGANEIAARMRRGAVGQSRVTRGSYPDCRCRDAQGVPDVMRGEETQILGALDDVVPSDRPGSVCRARTASGSKCETAGSRASPPT